MESTHRASMGTPFSLHVPELRDFVVYREICTDACGPRRADSSCCDWMKSYRTWKLLARVAGRELNTLTRARELGLRTYSTNSDDGREVGTNFKIPGRSSASLYPFAPIRVREKRMNTHMTRRVPRG